MTEAIEIDDRELGELLIDLRDAPARVQLGARKTMVWAKDKVQSAMKRDARGHRYLPHFPTAITSEMLDAYTAEIGFEGIPGTQGKLAHIILLGSINNAPVYDYTWALTRSTPAILEKFGVMAEEATLGSRDDE